MSQRVITALLLLLAVAGQASATRVMQQPEEAYELLLGQVSLPQRVGGSVIFKPCPDCQTVGLPVTAATRYFVSDQEVTLDALAEATNNLARTTNVAVFFDKASKFVNRLKIN